MVRSRPQTGDVGTRGCAVEADVHETAGLETIEQLAPPGPRVCHMVKDADALDDVEVPVQPIEIEDIGDQDLDIAPPIAVGAPLAISEAWRRQINGEQACLGPVGETGLQGLLPGSRPGDQHIARAIHEGEALRCEVPGEAGANAARRRDLHALPPRIWAPLILAPGRAAQVVRYSAK